MNDLFETISSSHDWMAEANCLNMDTDLWFPEFGGNYSPFAKEVCNACPVAEECLWYANEIGAQHGMFGGLTPNQRHEWRRKRGVQLHDRRAA
jgi:WhiB family redox-sensing transcriptional regulator